MAKKFPNWGENAVEAVDRKTLRAEELKAEIARLLPKAESGEQWADICALEAELVDLGGLYR